MRQKIQARLLVRKQFLNMRFLVDSLSSGKDVLTDISYRGIEFCNDDRFLISNNGSCSLELWDKTFAVLSSLSLPSGSNGIKMINLIEGVVVLYGKALLLFKLLDSVIVEMEMVNVPVLYDLTLHKGNYYIGSDKKTIVHDGYHKHVCDITVDGRVGYIAARDDDTLWYTIFDEKDLYYSSIHTT